MDRLASTEKVAPMLVDLGAIDWILEGIKHNYIDCALHLHRVTLSTRLLDTLRDVTWLMVRKACADSSVCYALHFSVL